jgi:hypothetical protein
VQNIYLIGHVLKDTKKIEKSALYTIAFVIKSPLTPEEAWHKGDTRFSGSKYLSIITPSSSIAQFCRMHRLFPTKQHSSPEKN